MEVLRNVRRKKETSISYEESLLQILREKVEDTGVDEDRQMLFIIITPILQEIQR
jgi:hypothetical protein